MNKNYIHTGVIMRFAILKYVLVIILKRVTNKHRVKYYRITKLNTYTNIVPSVTLFSKDKCIFTFYDLNSLIQIIMENVKNIHYKIL